MVFDVTAQRCEITRVSFPRRRESIFLMLLQKSRKNLSVIPAKAGHVRLCVKSIFLID